MLRDSKKNYDYWMNVIEHHSNQINKYMEMVKNVDSKEKVKRIEQHIYHEQFCNLICHYSSGASGKVLYDAYSNCLYQMEKIWSKSSSYVEMLWMTSIGILLNVSDIDVETMERIYKIYNSEDAIISFFLRYFECDIKLCENILFDIPYKTLLPLTKNADLIKCELILKEYLDTWYEKHNDTWWYGTDDSNLYIGYWCFEAAAFAKILNLDVNKFKNNTFFPCYE